MMSDVAQKSSEAVANGKLISIGIAVYQNAGSLPGLVDEIFEAFGTGLPGMRFEIVFVNDGSTDGSDKVLAELAAKHPGVISVVHFTRNFGQLFAMIAAVDHARGDAVISVSADQQDPIAVAVDMVRLWQAGSEIVIAHRANREDGIAARAFSSLAYGFLRLSTPSLPPGGFDYFLLDRRAADNIRAQRNRNRFFQTDVLGLGYRTAFIPYTRRARSHGRSQYSYWSRIRSLVNATVDSSYLPIRMMSSIGMVFVAMGMLYAASVAVARIMGQVPGGGYAVIVILLLTIGGLIILMLGILGEYVWRIYDELRAKPLYIVDKVIERAVDDHVRTDQR
jgi:glycosyltransferase involved in cell wall biosynthesis